MKEPIDIQPEIYDASSKVFGDKVYSQLLKAGGDLEGALAGSGAMAGSDPAGRQWAASYDEAARGVHAILIDLETACLKIAVMLQQTGFNHGMADSASDPTTSTPTPTDPAVYLPSKRTVPDLPSAQGGSTHLPAGWWLIEHTVGYLWPNGHPDRLRAATTAWTTCADAVVGASYYIPEAVQGILAQQSPEVHDAYTVCNSMWEHIEDTAAACREVAKACTDFADGIDKVHHDVEHELISLLEWTAAIQAGGLIVGIFTAGIGEGAAQAAEAARVAATAGRVAKIIQTVVDLASTLAQAINSVFSTIGKVAQRLLRIERAEVSEATVTAAAKAPNVFETAETAAVDGLTSAARIDQSASTFNANELKVANTLADEGKHVKAVPRSTERTPDAEVDGVPTEFKTIQSDTPNSATVRNTLNSSAKDGGQAREIIIDSRQAPLNQAEAERGISRFLGQGKDAYDRIIIWGRGWVVVWPR